jgi:hypothetical protein
MTHYPFPIPILDLVLHIRNSYAYRSKPDGFDALARTGICDHVTRVVEATIESVPDLT